MEIIDVINSFIKTFCINILTYITLTKLINFRNSNFIKIMWVIVISLGLAIMYMILNQQVFLFMTIMLIYGLYGILISQIINKKMVYITIITLISFAITYLLYMITIVLSGIIFKTIYPNIGVENIFIFVMAIIFEYIILSRFFKIRRFHKGITFLKNEEKIDNIGLTGLVFVGLAILIYSFIGNFPGETYMKYLFLGIIMEITYFVIWIRRKITKHYKQNLRRNQIKVLEETITAKDEEISRITKENNAIATINHKYSSRIKSLERISAKIFTSPEIIEKMKTEFGEEFGELEEQIKKISEEYTKEIEEKVKHQNKLDKTGIFGIDNILEYLREEAEKENIKLEIKLNASINYMIEKVIDQSRLETLLGDHIKDAIIAIKHSNNTYRSILVVIGIIDDCYEIKIYDTGIEFEIETLIKLGTEAITTHKETGGSGIGFMTTFETLKETKASLIIEEKHPMNNTDYTKSVAIRFDGKSEYRIKSYRAEEIEKQKGERDIKVNV